MRDLAVLVDIYQAICLIFEYSKNVSYEELEQNQEKQDAILTIVSMLLIIANLIRI